MSLALEVTQTVLRAVEETTPLDVVIETRPVTVEINAGTPLSDDIAAALNAANDPSASNPFATIDDLPGAFPFLVPVTTPWTTAALARTDIEAALKMHFQHNLASRTVLICLLIGNLDLEFPPVGNPQTVFTTQHAPVLAITTDVEHLPATAAWKVAPTITIQPGVVVYVVAILSTDFATMADVDVLIPDGISERVLLGAADDTVTSSPNFTRSAATGSVTNQATGELAPGLVGIAAGAGAPGVKGSSVEGDGVQGVGSGPSSAGVRGTGASGYGVVGSSTAGIGGVFTGPIGASVGATTDNGTALNISKGNVTLPPGRTVDGVDISEHALDAGAHGIAATIAAHVSAVDPHGDRADTTSQIGTHAAAVDPHGDRGYADGLASNYDAAGAASTAVSNHVSAVDPHGDRADTTSQIATHASDSGAHRNYARIFMMGA